MSIFSNPILSGNYDNIAIKGKQYYVPWKSAVITKSDKVLARIELKEEGKPSGDTLKFVSTSGLPVVATRLSDTLYEVQVDGISSKGEFGILATYNYPDSTGKEITVTAGQANISAYAMQEMNLVIVPVNQSAGVLAKVIEDSINAIYSQAATNWSVSLEGQLVIDEVNTSRLDDGDAGLLSNYTDDMEAIIKAYSEKKSGNIYKNTCYLFLVEGAKSGSGKEGYMPLKNQYGFIFTGNCAKVEHTIAHELGHGPFRLYHTFSEHNEYMQTEGSTKNLMDYTKNKEKNLYKYQWDLIHDPEAMIGLFQDEEEGESQLWSDPIRVQRKLEYFRWAYVNEQYAKFEADGYPYFGHFAKDIVLLNGVQYDKVHVAYISTVEFYPFKLDYSLFENGISVKYAKSDGSGALSFSANSLRDESLLSFNDYLFPTKEQYISQISKLLNEISNNLSNRSELLELLSILPAGDYDKLSAISRALCLKTIATGSIKENSASGINTEEIVINLIKYAPDGQLGHLFEKLQEDNLMQDLCSKIQNAFGEENYTKFIGALTSCFMRYRKDDMAYVLNNWKEYHDEQSNNKKITYFTWNREFSSDRRITYRKYYENNKIIIKTWPGGMFDLMAGDVHSYTRPPLDPFDIVTVYFRTPPKHVSENIPADVWLAMPAFMFEWYLNEFHNKQIAAHLDGAVTLASIIVPVTSISKGYMVLSIIHASIGAINFALLSDRMEQIVKNNFDDNTYDNWLSFSYLVSVAGSPFQDIVLEKHITNTNAFFAAWNAFKATEKYSYLLSDQASKEAIVLFDGLLENIKEIK